MIRFTRETEFHKFPTNRKDGGASLKIPPSKCHAAKELQHAGNRLHGWKHLSNYLPADRRRSRRCEILPFIVAWLDERWPLLSVSKMIHEHGRSIRSRLSSAFRRLVTERNGSSVLCCCAQQRRTQMWRVYVCGTTYTSIRRYKVGNLAAHRGTVSTRYNGGGFNTRRGQSPADRYIISVALYASV